MQLGGGLFGRFGIAIDASGNVWAVNGGNAENDSVTRMTGVASRVKTSPVSD